MIDLDDLDQLRLYDTEGRQPAAAAWRGRLAEDGLHESAVDAAWLDSLLPDAAQAGNPAKQLAQRLYERTPLFWAAPHLAALPPAWQQQVMHTAEAAALCATLDQVARDWSMVRLPRFWPNALVAVWISDGGEEPTERQLAADVQALLGRRRYQVTEAAVPSGATRRATIWHGEQLGRWLALYLAALYGVDPAARVAWDYLGLT